MKKRDDGHRLVIDEPAAEDCQKDISDGKERYESHRSHCKGADTGRGQNTGRI